MTLTTNGINYIKNKFGNTSNCFTNAELNWTYTGTDSVVYTETNGGTAQIVSNLVMTSLVQSVTISGITYTYADLKAANDDKDITLDDAKWIAQIDGFPEGENKICDYTPPQSNTLLYTAGIIGIAGAGYYILKKKRK